MSSAVVNWKHTTIRTKVPNIISPLRQQGTFTSTQCTKVQGSEALLIKTDKVLISSSLRELIKERFCYNILVNLNSVLLVIVTHTNTKIEN